MEVKLLEYKICILNIANKTVVEKDDLISRYSYQPDTPAT